MDHLAWKTLIGWDVAGEEGDKSIWNFLTRQQQKASIKQRRRYHILRCRSDPKCVTRFTHHQTNLQVGMTFTYTYVMVILKGLKLYIVENNLPGEGWT